MGTDPELVEEAAQADEAREFQRASDSVADKPMFAKSFARRRFLIPVSGYYEWVATPTGKQPYYFTRRDGQTITIAGIQDGWINPGQPRVPVFVRDGHHRRE